MKSMRNLRILRGDGVVDGIEMDKAIVSDSGKITVPKYHVRPIDLHNELKRYRQALRAVRKKLVEDQQRILGDRLGQAERPWAVGKQPRHEKCRGGPRIRSFQR